MTIQTPAITRRAVMKLTGGAAVAGGFASYTGIRDAIAAYGQQSGGGPLRLAMVGDFIPSFYPAGTWTGNQFLLFNSVFSTLVELGPDLEVRGDLAEEWEVSEDAASFTFRLHTDAVWHDGEPVTSEDVAFSFRYYLRDEAAVGFTNRLQQLVGATDFMEGATDELPGIETPDESTVVLNLTEPNAAFLIALREPFHFILPKHILEEVAPDDIETHPFATSEPIGSGPYRVIEMLPDQYVELEAFPDYFRGAPLIQTVFQKFLPSELVLAQLESGELDLGLRLNPLDYDRLESNTNLQAIARPGVGVITLAVNNRVITDKLVRQAMSYAINRQGIIDAIYSGRAELLVAPPAMNDYPGLNDYAYDPEMARELLQEAGWDSQRTVRLIYDTIWPGASDITPLLQQQLGDVGIQVELEPLETVDWIERYRNEPDSWELAWTQGGTEALDPDVSSIYYNNNSDTAIGFYTNDELQRLFIEGRSTGVESERDEIYAEAAQIINEEMPVIYLWTPYDVHGAVVSLQNVEIFPYPPETTNDVYKWQFE